MDTAAPILPTQYQSSKGLIDIADMAYPHLLNAIAKLEREGRSDPVLSALIARRDVLDQDLKDAEAAMPAPVVEIGHNGDPDASPFDIIKGKVEDIRIEALNWLDGADITTPAEAAEVEKLLDMVRGVKAEAEAAKETEKKPHMEAANEVQARYNTIIGKTQKVTGSALIIEDTIKAAMTKWRNKLEADRKAEADNLRKIAAEQAERAAEAFKAAAGTSDLDEREAMIAEIDKAKETLFAAHAVEKAKTGGLRTVWNVEVTDAKALAGWFWSCRKDDLIAFMTGEALRTVRAASGNIVINGVKNVETKVAF